MSGADNTNSSKQTSDEPRLLDLISFPLHGIRLIEASAGTGKTYTLSNLYLRMILGHGDEQAAHPVPLRVDQILMMTFTRAATAELKTRIRSKVHLARVAFQNPAQDVSDGFIEQLRQAYSETDFPALVDRLEAAERQMDQSAIYTIHGFCQRVLKQYAFESGQLFECQLTEDEDSLLLQATTDFWRHHFYNASCAFTEFLCEFWSTPDGLKDQVKRWHGRSDINMLIEQEHSLEWLFDKIKQIEIRIIRFKQDFLSVKDEIQALIDKSDIKKQIYKKNYLPKWISEVSSWSQGSSLTPPDSFYRFSQLVLEESTKSGGVAPEHPVFKQCQAIIEDKPNIRGMILRQAIPEIHQRLQNLKQQTDLMSTDDLLSRLAEALISGPSQESLAESLRQQYPVAMVDEFQDTDGLQYNIFTKIYCTSQTTKTDEKKSIEKLVTAGGKNCGLFFIGDPKQAIYAFRGADIFTYIKARQQTEHHYTLGTNWRSSDGVVNAVNKIFLSGKNPFIYEDSIPFIPVRYAPGADKKYILCEGNKLSAMYLWHWETATSPGVTDYRNVMTDATVSTIQQLLSLSVQGSCHICRGSKKTPLQPSDLAILVRKRSEAQMIKNALTKQRIASVFLSERGSVFDTQEAEDLYHLMAACVQPDSGKTLRAALAVSLLDLTAQDIEELNENEHCWEQRTEQFQRYHNLWLQEGIEPMLRHLALDFKFAENLLQYPEGERILTNYFHLTDLLSSAATDLDGPFALLSWMKQRLESGQDVDGLSTCLRLESDQNKVQIVTIHKSKGLEYPVVFLPFVAVPPGNRNRSATPCFHNEDLQFLLDLRLDNKTGIEAEEKETLAEELRLLYVALTRSIYSCYIGIAATGGSKSKADQQTRFHQTAIGYLLQQGEALAPAALTERLGQFVQNTSGSVISILPPPEKAEQYYQHPASADYELSALKMECDIADNWWVSSYSSLTSQDRWHSAAVADGSAVKAVFSAESAEKNAVTSDEEETSLSIFDFEKGARAGTFLHSLFENISFSVLSDEKLEQTIVAQMHKHGWGREEDLCWQPVFKQLVCDILNADLLNGLKLANLKNRQRFVEMEFYFPVSKLHVNTVNQILRQYDPLSARALPLNFMQTRGLIKGFIDLTFEYQGKFYVLDYKSNYLGDKAEDYTQEAMKQAMIDRRYDFQYQLYTLALHRLLQKRMPDYDYNLHMGGVFYLFLRGIKAEAAEKDGIFYCKPDYNMIKALDFHITDEINTPA